MNEQPGRTPGPWRVEAVTYAGDKQPSYGVTFGDRPYWIMAPGHNEADCHLVAAAPEMLAALKAIQQMWMVRNMPADAPFRVELEAIFLPAIAKATGADLAAQHRAKGAEA